MKRTVSLLLSLVLIFTFVPPAFAASDEAINAANALHELGIFNGTGTDANGNPNFNLDRSFTRYEGITMLVRLLGKEDEAVSGTWNTPFTDVVDWAKPYIGYAYENGLAAGSTTTTFSGAATMSATQYITLVLRALGYESGTDFQWDRAWELSDKIGLTNGEYNASTANFTRGDVAIISNRALYLNPVGENITLAASIGIHLPISQNRSFNYLAEYAKERGELKEDGRYSYVYGYDSSGELETLKQIDTFNLYYDENSNEISIEFSRLSLSSSSLFRDSAIHCALIIPANVPDVLDVIYTYTKNPGEYYGTLNSGTFTGSSDDVTFSGNDPNNTFIGVYIHNALTKLDQSIAKYGDAAAVGIRGLGFTAINSNILSFNLEAQSYTTSGESYSILNQDYTLYIRTTSWKPNAHTLKIGFYNIETGQYYTADVNADAQLKINSVGLPAGTYKVYIGNPGTATISGCIQYWLEQG